MAKPQNKTLSSTDVLPKQCQNMKVSNNWYFPKTNPTPQMSIYNKILSFERSKNPSNLNKTDPSMSTSQQAIE